MEGKLVKLTKNIDLIGSLIFKCVLAAIGGISVVIAPDIKVFC